MKRPEDKNKSIPIHKLGDRTDIGVEVRYIDKRQTTAGDRIAIPHRDDHFLFIFQEEGESRLFVDFQEVVTRGCALICILPGQVHYNISMEKATGWMVSMSPLLAGTNPAVIFEEDQVYPTSPLAITGPAAEAIKACARSLQHQLKSEASHVGDNSIPLLSGAFAAMAANHYADRQKREFKARNRSALITNRFKALLTKNFRTQKSPAEYARALNYSLSHLNESVKSGTGLPVSYWIQHQVLLEARRLLYHSELSIKEIAASLGYEDHAYFSRLFTAKTGMSPGAFRKKFRG